MTNVGHAAKEAIERRVKRAGNRVVSTDEINDVSQPPEELAIGCCDRGGSGRVHGTTVLLGFVPCGLSRLIQDASNVRCFVNHSSTSGITKIRAERASSSSSCSSATYTGSSKRCRQRSRTSIC